MTAKLKAEEIVIKYLPLVDCGDNIYTTKVQKENAKQCALIAVDEIFSNNTDESKHNYWIEVKEEIEKL